MGRKRTIAFFSAVVLLGLCSWISSLYHTQWVPKDDISSHAEVFSESGSMSSDRFLNLDEIRSVSRDNVIIVVSVNRETVDFAMNWLCSMKRIGIENYVFVTTDGFAYEFLGSIGETVYKDTLSEQSELARISYIKKILDMGIDVLTTGEGVVWLKNPLPLLEIEMTQDVLGQLGDNDSPSPLFMLIRASDRTRGVWSEVLIDMERLSVQNGVVVTASHAQEVIHKHISRSGVTLCPLPPALFSQGSEYFSDSYTGSPALILNGDVSSLDEQKSRLMRHNLWLVDRSGASLTCRAETEVNTDPAGAEVVTDPAGAEVEALTGGTNAELKMIIADRRDPDTNSLIVATVNWEFLDFALNWLCSIRRLGLRNYVFYATDERAYEWLLAAGEPVYREVEADDAKVQSVDYGTVAYQQLVLLRARFILKVLEQGCGVLSADVDAVWLQNPFPHMGTTADVYAQQEKNGDPCAGFILTRATDGNVGMWREFLEDLEAKVKESIRKGRLTFINQQFVLLTHMKERGTVINRLPKNLFPSGDLYFSDSYTGSPVVVHNNFIIGHDPKMERFQNKQLWWVEGEPGSGFRCEGSEQEWHAGQLNQLEAEVGADPVGADVEADRGAEDQVDTGDGNAELEKIIADRRDPDTNSLIVATVNWEFLDFALNWLCSIRRLGLRNYVFYATDERAYEWLLAAGEPVYREVEGDDAKVQSVDYGTVAYQHLVLLRARFTLKVLEQGCSVLSADVDAVWLQNPFPHMGTTADVYAQQEKNGDPCAGFILTRATDGNVRMWREFLEDLEAKVEESFRKGRLTFTNQQFVLLTHMKERGTVINRLPKNLFPSGDLYFSDSYTGSPVVVHNNFIVGHDPKMERFQNKQLWWVEGEPVTGFRCEGSEKEWHAGQLNQLEAEVGADPVGEDVEADRGAEAQVDTGDGNAELEKIIADRRDPDTNSLIVATVNWEFLDFALNWLCSIRRLGLRNYVFYATDERAYEWLLEAGEPVYREVEADDAKVQSVDYGTVAYQQLVLLRARFILKVLEQGCGVLSADVDAVWLQNPFPHMGTTADVYAQQEKNGDPCAGFILTRATDGNVGMWREFLEDLEAKVKESIRKGRLTFTNQQFVLLTHMKERGTVINRLPKNLFPSGDLYFSDSYTGSPVVVHNNFIIGHDPKMERFQNKQLWWVEGGPGSGFRCEGSEKEWHAGQLNQLEAEVGADPVGADVEADTGVEDQVDTGDGNAELEKIIADRRDPDTNSLIVATVNWEFLDFALNWLCSIRRLGLRNYVFYATDERAYEWLLAAGEPVYREVEVDDAKIQSVDYGTVAYQQLVLLRARFILKVLEQGCGVLSADVDAVWLQNPFPHMGTTADVYAQQEKNGDPCAGFILTRATDGNVGMWREFLEDLEAKVKESIRKRRLTFTNQQFVLLTHMKERGTVINRLPKNLFPSGDLYFSDSYTGSPVVVHNNFIVGHDPKMERFQNKQLWWVEGEPVTGFRCEGSEKEWHAGQLNQLEAEVEADTGAEVEADTGDANAELKKIIADRRDPDTNSLIVATVNWDFLDFALNWLCSIRRLGLRNYVFYATDERAYEWLLAAGEPVYLEVEGDDAKIQSVDYGTVAYQHLVLLRARFTLKVLEQGCGVLSADVDAVWLENPFPHMGTTADVYAQQEKNGDPCAGFILTRATDGNVRMWREFLEDLEAKVEESFKKGRLTFTNQQFVLLTHMKERGTVINRLPKNLFPSGDLFFSDSYTGSPVVVHNNFIVGHDPKMERFQNKQMWWVEGEPGTGFRCEVTGEVEEWNGAGL